MGTGDEESFHRARLTDNMSQSASTILYSTVYSSPYQLLTLAGDELLWSSVPTILEVERLIPGDIDTKAEVNLRQFYTHGVQILPFVSRVTSTVVQ